MTNWTKTAFGLEATINGRDYLIEKDGIRYTLYCKGEPIIDNWLILADAKAAAEEHAAGPTPMADGVHIDAIAGQQLVDILKRSFTVDEINKMMEASPYDEPDTGAPEGPLS